MQDETRAYIEQHYEGLILEAASAKGDGSEPLLLGLAELLRVQRGDTIPSFTQAVDALSLYLIEKARRELEG